MENELDGLAAIRGLQNCMFDGSRINVEHSHGRRGGDGSGRPFRRREERIYNTAPYPVYYPRFTNSPLPFRIGRSVSNWDNRSHYSYGSVGGDPRGYDYFSNRISSNYVHERDYRQFMPCSVQRDYLPPSVGLDFGGCVSSPHLEHRKPPMPQRSFYRSYVDYDRYREPSPDPPSHFDDYDNYGNYSSGVNYE